MRKTLSVGAAGVPEVLRGIVTSMISKTATSVKKAVMSNAVMSNSFSLITTSLPACVAFAPHECREAVALARHEFTRCYVIGPFINGMMLAMYFIVRIIGLEIALG
jgi:hypothetical protein